MSFGVGTLLALGALGLAAILEKMNFGSLIAPSPLILVFIGCTGASLIGYQVSEWKRIPKAFLVAITGKVPDASETVSAFARYADLARKEGIL
ncbi:MAG TPA: motility protein A, partial [Actinomycetota bacterium]